MNRWVILSLAFVAGCLGDGSGSNTVGLHDDGTEEQPDNGMQPGEPTDPGQYPDPGCAQLEADVAACWASTWPACESAYTAVSQCYEGIELACQGAYEALELCLQSGMLGCDAERLAAEACREQYVQCLPLEEAAASCSAPCTQLEERFFSACVPPPPPPPDFPPYCGLLFEALASCQAEAAGQCGVSPDGRMQDPGMRPDQDCFSRCASIEAAIAELCAVQHPCPGEGGERPPPDPHGENHGGMGEGSGRPGN